MAAPGRPTPQPVTDERPRFKDRLPDDYRRADINPFVRSHRTFGPELLPADDVWRWRGRWAERFGNGPVTGREPSGSAGPPASTPVAGREPSGSAGPPASTPVAGREPSGSARLPASTPPLHLEIGSGNGFFLAGFAAQNPDLNILGIEIRYKRTVLCAKKIREAGLKNALVARYHAAYLDDLFEPGSLAGIHVNHPDPWPKEKHEKNRLISRWFLEDVVRLLRPGGIFRLKSDFRDNVDRVEALLAEDPPLPLHITGRSDDVNGLGAPWPNDIVTNYQRKMLERGVPVYAIELVRT